MTEGAIVIWRLFGEFLFVVKEKYDELAIVNMILSALLWVSC